MKKIVRNLSTEEARSFWRATDQVVRELQGWPDWKRAGVAVAPTHSELYEHQELVLAPESSERE